MRTMVESAYHDERFCDKWAYSVIVMASNYCGFCFMLNAVFYKVNFIFDTYSTLVFVAETIICIFCAKKPKNLPQTRYNIELFSTLVRTYQNLHKVNNKLINLIEMTKREKKTHGFCITISGMIKRKTNHF